MPTRAPTCIATMLIIIYIYSKDPADRIKTIIHFKKKYYMSRFAGRNFNR
jgi:hypothetical protein